MRAAQDDEQDKPGLSRRGLLIGAAAAGGLALAWSVWPRAHSPALSTAPGEHILSAYLKVGMDGHVTVITPQVELGQGNVTLIAQILADELGADWRTVSVEAAPVNALYANPSLEAAWREGLWSTPTLQGTDEALDFGALERTLRHSAAAARTLLCKAAGKRWNASWDACTTENGFVVRGHDKVRFGEVAEEAASLSLPDDIPLRTDKRPLFGERLPRLDVPAKLDGSVTYAADIRLADMVFASIRMAPWAGGTLAGHDGKAARATPGFAGIVTEKNWIAAAANTWWAADRALGAARPRFSVAPADASDKAIKTLLDTALSESGDRMAQLGDVDDALGEKAVERLYSTAFAPHAALEPMAATATLEGGQLRLWMSAQVPEAARKAAAEAAGVSVENVILHPVQGGGSFGRRYEVEVAAQVAAIARSLNRPVQLLWPRSEDMAQDRVRPATSAKISARIGAGGRIEALRMAIAAPHAMAETRARADGEDAASAMDTASGETGLSAVWSGIMPYAIADWAIDHHAATLPVPTGLMRGGAAGYGCFFLESFIDEMARGSGIDPFSIRMGMLAGNPRLAMCLSLVATRGGWVGGAQGTGQGLACYSTGSSHIAVLAEARLDENQHVQVSKLVAVADVGRMLNPEIALQQVEGSLLHGLALATMTRTGVDKTGLQPRTLGALNWPRLAQMPDISLEIIASPELSGPLGEFALPAVAPAIANAIVSASGQRFRSLPLGAS